MRESKLHPGSLVLYKGRPARVMRTGAKKVIIELDGDEQLSVRPKDVVLLHKGPLESLDALQAVKGEINVAWELLQGETTTLTELAELAFGTFTPHSAWAAWQHVDDGVYFSGSPDQIAAHTAEEAAETVAAQEAKKAEQKAWDEFVDRTAQGKYAETDLEFLRDVEALALGKREQSRVLQALGHAETPQLAHVFLLRLGYWDHRVNPYPSRAGVDTTPPRVTLSQLPTESRRDLTHLRALAIDDEESKDPDDALSIEDGRLWVHIADVAALVPPDSEPDLIARDRGANLYLPEGTSPMLPPEATRFLGLGLEETSPALSFGMEIRADGEINGVEIVPSWVQVERVTYEKASQSLDMPLLQALNDLAEVYESRRRREGAVFIDLPEAKITVRDGEVEVRPLPPLRSREVVREAMLMVGESVARFAQEHDIPMPYSSQEAIHDVEPSPTRYSEMYALRRAMKPSRYRISPTPHGGLGMDRYVKATSPLRRYLDLVAHQQLRAFLSGRALLSKEEVLERVGTVEAITASLRWVERRSAEHWTLVYLLQNPGWQGEGFVIDRRGTKCLILIPELALEAELYSRKELPLDSQVALRLREINLPELEAHFSLDTAARY